MGALNKDSYKEGTLHDVMQRLRENLSLWCPDDAVCQHSVPADVDIDEHLADGIRALVVTKLQAAEPDGLNVSGGSGGCRLKNGPCPYSVYYCKMRNFS